MCVCARMRFPPSLKTGSRVALVAPAGPVRGEMDIERAVETTRTMGWEPVVGAHVGERSSYLAGTDEHRLADLNRAAADDSIDAVWCIRGGYGCMRLLDGLDYDAWRKRPRALIGYSDITALHAAIGARAELVTFHGPTARGELTPFSASLLKQALCGRDPCVLTAHDAETLRPGRARGRLAGGNLALVASLAGTPYAPSLDGTILVVEDVNESVYRIDRMFTQLRLTGALGRVAGIAFGQFSEIPTADDGAEESRPLGELLKEVADQCAVPCIANIPLGHISDQWTLPLGALVELDADAKSLSIEASL